MSTVPFFVVGRLADAALAMVRAALEPAAFAAAFAAGQQLSIGEALATLFAVSPAARFTSSPEKSWHAT